MGQPRDQAVGEATAEARVEAIAEAKKVTISSGLDPDRLCSKIPKPLQQWHCNDIAVWVNHEAIGEATAEATAEAIGEAK